LQDVINPAWQNEINAFGREVAVILSGPINELNYQQWQQIKSRLTPFNIWQSRKAGQTVEKLGLERLKEIISSNGLEVVYRLSAEDKSLEPQFNAISSLDRLIRYYLNLHLLLNNFVSFRDFYDTRGKAIFQAGTLYMDSRSCELCVKVADTAKHSVAAVSCNTFLAYCDCTKQGGSEKMTIAAAFTDGDSDQLLPGRNGLFIDRNGNYWDATISKIIDHPISIRQAFWAPYRRLGRMIQEQIEKYAAARDKSSTDMLSETVAATGEKVSNASATAAPVPFDAGRFAGIFAAIGLAVAAIGSAAASVVSGFLSLSWWQMPLAVAGIALLVSGPSMLIAALRLRQRNLGAILNANGWAVNTRARINMNFGKNLTRIAELPKGSFRSFDDPFAEKQMPWKLYLTITLVLLLILTLSVHPKAGSECLKLINSCLTCKVEEKTADNQVKAVSEKTIDGKSLPKTASTTTTP
jgi:hypothetical protein